MPRGFTLMAILLLGYPPAHAQTASPVPSTATPAPAPPGTAPARSFLQTRTGLFSLVSRLRPALLRIEDCPPEDCRVPNSVGTAFHIGDGYAISAYQIIFRARNLTALTSDKKRYPVEVVGFDDRSDLALLRIKLPASQPALPLAAVRPAVGELTLTIGNPLGQFMTPKVGRITALNTSPGRPDFPTGALQLETQIAPGDGGAPILTARGEVVAVVSYLATGGRQSRRVTAYAVPLTQNDARLVELRRGVKLEAPATGVFLELPTGTQVIYALPARSFVEFSDRLKLDLGSTPGAFFTQVAAGSPAARAGLQALQFDKEGKRTAGDLVTAVNGQRVVNFLEFDSAIYRHQPGDMVTLTVLRAGKPLEVRLTLVARSQVANP